MAHGIVTLIQSYFVLGTIILLVLAYEKA